MDFRKYFEFKKGDNHLYSYRLFFNCSTGYYEIVSRSGDIVCIVPPIKRFSRKEHLELARTILGDFQEGLMLDYDEDSKLRSYLLCVDEVFQILNSLDYDPCYLDLYSLPPIKYNF
jgi:hypothetical protein